MLLIWTWHCILESGVIDTAWPLMMALRCLQVYARGDKINQDYCSLLQLFNQNHQKIRALKTIEPAKSQIGHRLPNKTEQHVLYASASFGAKGCNYCHLYMCFIYRIMGKMNLFKSCNLWRKPLRSLVLCKECLVIK